MKRYCISAAENTRCSKKLTRRMIIFIFRSILLYFSRIPKGFVSIVKTTFFSLFLIEDSNSIPVMDCKFAKFYDQCLGCRTSFYTQKVYRSHVNTLQNFKECLKIKNSGIKLYFFTDFDGKQQLCLLKKLTNSSKFLKKIKFYNNVTIFHCFWSKTTYTKMTIFLYWHDFVLYSKNCPVMLHSSKLYGLL